MTDNNNFPEPGQSISASNVHDTEQIMMYTLLLTRMFNVGKHRYYLTLIVNSNCFITNILVAQNFS